jgi:hypothetical protein
MAVRVNEDDKGGPGFLHAFAPVGFALGFVLFCFMLPVVVVLVFLWFLAG